MALLFLDAELLSIHFKCTLQAVVLTIDNGGPQQVKSITTRR